MHPFYFILRVPLPARFCILPINTYYIIICMVSFSGICSFLFSSLLAVSVFVFVVLCSRFMLSLDLRTCPSDFFLSSRPRTVPDWQPRLFLGIGQCEEHTHRSVAANPDNLLQ